MTLVIGIGTGRCGTKTLARFLDSQPNSCVTHERYSNRVPWGYRGQEYLDTLIAESESATDSLQGDVAFYWLPHIERLLTEISPKHSIKVLVLKRTKKKTVQSYLRKVPSNPWKVEMSANTTSWHKCFPKFACKTRRQCLECYWSYYYGEVARLKTLFPDRVLVIQTESLAKKRTLKEILTCLCVPANCQQLKVYNENQGMHPIYKRYIKKSLKLCHSLWCKLCWSKRPK